MHDILSLYIRVCSFSYSKDIVHRYRIKAEQNKSKSLRKEMCRGWQGNEQIKAALRPTDNLSFNVDMITGISIRYSLTPLHYTVNMCFLKHGISSISPFNAVSH